MTDYEARLEAELRRAIDAHAPRREPWIIRIPRPRVPVLASVAALLLALVVGIGIGQRTGDDDRAAVPAAAPLPRGTFTATGGAPEGVPAARRFELWIREDSMRLTGIDADLPFAVLLGFAETRGDRVQLRIDADRARTSDFDDPRCRRTGTYRFAVKGDTLRFTLVDDPCPLRRTSLPGRTWRR